MSSLTPTILRRTLNGDVLLRSPALFIDRVSTLTIRPAPAGEGITFTRTDLAAATQAATSATMPIPALVTHIASQARSSILVPSGALSPASGVATVEHLLSAMSAMGITDARCEVDAPELPMLDGSAAPFLAALESVGVRTLDATIAPIIVREPVLLEHGRASLHGLPLDTSDEPALHIDYTLDYTLNNGPAAPPAPAALRHSTAHFVLRPAGASLDDYRARIAPARTFSTLPEARALVAAGFCTHLRPPDVLIFDDHGPIDTTIRMPAEPATHKLLDVIGDLALAGRPILARVVASLSGHQLNHRAARTLLALPAH
jgi:UDP-3-O-[3-hydroxymyristoyl] N-acetylglucosamine deacetylase